MKNRQVFPMEFPQDRLTDQVVYQDHPGSYQVPAMFTQNVLKNIIHLGIYIYIYMDIWEVPKMGIPQMDGKGESH